MRNQTGGRWLGAAGHGVLQQTLLVYVGGHCWCRSLQIVSSGVDPGAGAAGHGVRRQTLPVYVGRYWLCIFSCRL